MALDRGVAITWLGHGTFYIVSPGGKRILIDPFLKENPACPSRFKALDAVDLILVTHGHFDHTSNVVEVARRAGAPVVSNFEICEWVNGKGHEHILPMNKGGTQHWEGIAITMTHADHSSGIDDGGRMVDGGEPVGYVLRFENGFTLYHAGDTALFGDMKLIGELYQPELAILPIGDHFTMGPREAAYAIRLLGVKKVLGGHYGTFPALKGTPTALRAAAKDVAGLTVFELRPGETLT